MMNITLTSEISSPSQPQDIDANHPPVRARRRAAPRSGPIPIPFIWATDRGAKMQKSTA